MLGTALNWICLFIALCVSGLLQEALRFSQEPWNMNLVGNEDSGCDFGDLWRNHFLQRTGNTFWDWSMISNASMEWASWGIIRPGTVGMKSWFSMFVSMRWEEVMVFYVCFHEMRCECVGFWSQFSHEFLWMMRSWFFYVVFPWMGMSCNERMCGFSKYVSHEPRRKWSWGGSKESQSVELWSQSNPRGCASWGDRNNRVTYRPPACGCRSKPSVHNFRSRLLRLLHRGITG